MLCKNPLANPALAWISRMQSSPRKNSIYVFKLQGKTRNLCLLNELPSSRHGRLQGRFLWRQRQFIFARDTDTWAWGQWDVFWVKMWFGSTLHPGKSWQKVRSYSRDWDPVASKCYLSCGEETCLGAVLWIFVFMFFFHVFFLLIASCQSIHSSKLTYMLAGNSTICRCIFCLAMPY